MASTLNLKKTLKENTMFIALIAVMLLFQILIVATDHGSLFAPANITNIINQNSYVLILATGMLLCILTGGNIDLSVGSIVCLVGAIAGTLICNLHCNIYLSILFCLITGTLIGAWHGLWIAFVHIPPFIVTLSGMLLWRGVALIVLNGLTISPFPDNYLNLFSSYIPGEAEAETIFAITMVIALICCAIMIATQALSRISKIKKGYEQPSIVSFIIKMALTTAIILVIASLLGKHKGLPVILILIAVIVACYTYYTENTVPGRYLYAI